MEKNMNMLTTQEFPDKEVGIPAHTATNGEKIKALRMAKGMKKSELAKRIALSDRSIRFIEAGGRNPGEYTLKKIAAVLGVTMDYFTDTTISKEELDDVSMFEKVCKKYGSNNAMQAKEITEKTREFLYSYKLSKDERFKFIKQMEILLEDAKTELCEDE